MKQRTFIFSLLLSFCLCAFGQQPESLYSHVSERIYLDGNGTSHIDNVTYLDGFGRKSQETGISGTPDGTGDLILPYRYGQGGRTEFEYLPYPKTGNGGAYDPTYLLPINWNTYGGQDAGYAYSLTEYECSPLDHITRRTGPGAAWHTSGKSVSYSYAMNATGEVPLYRISLSGMPVSGGHYGAGSLRKVTATDEDGRTTETFTDNAGRTVLTVAADGSARFPTCRVYDDHGRLRWVLPPEAVRLLSTGAGSSQLHGTAWYYEYDRLGRQTFRRAPGCDPVYTVYDNNDRPVLVQDGNLRARNAALWEYRRYDGAGRLTESGELLLTSASTHASLQALLLQGGELPQGTCTPLQYTVYDSYTSVAGFSPHAFQAVSGYSGDYHREVVGLTAYTCSRVLGTDEWTVTAYYYDEQCRVIQTISNMLRGGLYRTDTAYDFTGRMLKCRETYDGRTMENTYVYDSRSRLLSVSASLNGNAPVSLIRNEYDGVGRLKSVTHNDMNSLKTNYTYNVRSWVTNMSNPLYSQTLTYGYGGNIATQQWVQDSKTRKYTYTYDGLNRLTHAAYTGDGNYTANYSYDNMGNITSLKRYDVSLVDNLTYTYNGNQLTKVEDATSNAFGFANGASTTNEYTYDANGNLTKDSNKGIASITYNSLNLPQVVTFSNGNTITYLYTADGRKLRTVHVIGGTATTTDYCGNVIYENGTAKLLLTEAGYVDLTDNSHHFYIKDHLGNNRVVADANGTVEESNQYYPFGLNYANANSNLQPYKYNGKELDTKAGLNWYDYGARHYDAALGRWHVVDPLGEERYSNSVYSYTSNTPINKIDSNGMLDDWVKNLETNEYEWMDNVTSIENTPSGYKYIGNSSEDILTSLNLRTQFDVQKVTTIGIGFNGNLAEFLTPAVIASGIAIEGNSASVSGHISVKANIAYNIYNASSDNCNGIKFEGITIMGSMIYKSMATSFDYQSDFKGFMSVQFGNIYMVPLKIPTNPIVYESGTNVLSASLTIPASKLNSNYWGDVRIQAGTLNNNIIIGPNTVDMKWNLLKNSIFIQGK